MKKDYYWIAYLVFWLGLFATIITALIIYSGNNEISDYRSCIEKCPTTIFTYKFKDLECPEQCLRVLGCGENKYQYSYTTEIKAKLYKCNDEGTNCTEICVDPSFCNYPEPIIIEKEIQEDWKDG